MTGQPQIYVGVDIGGTFTDVVAYDEATGEWRVGKVPTSSRPEEGVLAALASVLDRPERSRTRLVAHATTLGINAIVERRGARTGLVTTHGFSDLLFMGTGQRYDVYDLYPKYPRPLVEPDAVVSVVERLAPSGERLVPLDKGSASRAVEEVLAAGAESIAICFLHSYIDPEHESFVEGVAKEKAPDIPVSVSALVSPEIREYPRLCTTVANAYIRPIVGRYMSVLSGLLATEGYSGQLVTMLSDGGMVGPEAASVQPVRILESGPAAGSILAEVAAARLATPDMLLFDMGGTTAKLSTIVGGNARRTPELEVARVHRFKAGSGIPLRTPVVDLIEIGAGGGSIARVDDRGLIAVGPESSAADPGPACYGRGGTAPTVTDADLVLGYLGADRFLGGRMHLDIGAARDALARLGASLAIDVYETARFVRSTVNASMAGAARVHLAERGIEPDALSLLAIGGAGPLHAEDVGREIGTKCVLVPLDPSTGSALGLLLAPVAFEVARSAPTAITALSNSLIAEVAEGLSRLAREELIRVGAKDVDIVEVLSADMHVEGQSREIRVVIDTAGSEDVPASLQAAFERAYREDFGRSPLDRPIHLNTWRLRASAPSPGPKWTPNTQPSAVGPPVPVGHRPVLFSGADDFMETPIYNRAQLRPRERVIGPAIIEEPLTTTAAGPFCEVEVLDDYSLLLGFRA